MQSRLLVDPPARGDWNMAVDEVLLEQAGQGAAVACGSIAGPSRRFRSDTFRAMQIGAVPDQCRLPVGAAI